MNTLPFLCEIGTEELPARYIPAYAAQWKKLFADACKAQSLSPGDIHTDGTPRRLMLFCESLPVKQPAETLTLRGPAADIAFKDGKPTKAAEGFCKKNGVSLDDVTTQTCDGKEYLMATVTRGGADTRDILCAILPEIIRQLKAPKSMRWGTSPTVFARPIRWLLALFGDDVVSAQLDAITADRITYGHRFLAPERISLDTADRTVYEARLKDAYVIVPSSVRKDTITRGLAAHPNETVKQDDALIETCTFLTEWPTLIRGTFPEELLTLPEPVLSTSLKTHQKSFLLHHPNGAPINAFLAVTNNDLAHQDVIRAGYERVVVARLKDAQFFWNEDLQHTLRERTQRLKDIVFHEKLGTYYDKTQRVISLVRSLAEHTGLTSHADDAQRAAELARADLTSSMVFEFPELQGTMGRIYSNLCDKENENVCAAIEEMYLPRSADDALPSSPAGALLSIADKLDTLCGCCAAGHAPTGSADPFALRRQTLGILRTVIHHTLSLPLRDCVEDACAPFAEIMPIDTLSNIVLDIVHGRRETVLKDLGIPYDVISAVCAATTDDITRIAARATTLTRMHDDDVTARACTVVERCARITRDCISERLPVNADLFVEEGEHSVYHAWQTAQDALRTAMTTDDMAAALTTLSGEFYENLERFFTDIRVNVDDTKLRQNRLALLYEIYRTIADQCADLSLLVFSSHT